MLREMKRSLYNSRVLIYGTGGNGRLLCKSLVKTGVLVEGFLDKRADNLKDVLGFPVCSPDGDFSCFGSVDDIIIFVTVKNVFDHDRIVHHLLQKGFQYFVYKPGAVLRGGGNSSQLSTDAAYQSMIEDKIRQRKTFPDVEIVRTEKIEFPLTDRFLLSKDGRWATVWLPVELLFNYKEAKAFPGINMELFYPLLNLYRAFMGDPGVNVGKALEDFFLYTSEWMAENAIAPDESQKRSMVESRYRAYLEMEDRWAVDTDFFIKNAPTVKADNNKRFFMESSGRNRVVFQIAKGRRLIPVKMEAADYEKLLVMSPAEEKMKFRIGGGSNVFSRHLHPLLYFVECDFPEYHRILAALAMELLRSIYESHVYEAGRGMKRIDFGAAEEQKKSTFVICLLKDERIAADYFSRLGFAGQTDDGTAELVICDRGTYIDNLEGIHLLNPKYICILQYEDCRCVPDGNYSFQRSLLCQLEAKGIRQADVYKKTK